MRDRRGRHRWTMPLLATVLSSAVVVAQSAIQYFYDELGRLIAVVDPAGDTATYAYDAVGNILSIGRHPSSQVSIISFSPTSGSIGTTVIVSGTGFSPTAAQNTVTFNGTATTVSDATSTRLTVTVPAGATTGPIAVTSPGGSATSSTLFMVTGSLAPTITSFVPTIGTASTAVTIDGTNFETTATNNRVSFNAWSAAASSSTSTSIATAVPTGATSGHISVATPRGATVSAADFFVPPSPYGANDVAFTGRTSVGGSIAVSIGTATRIGLVVFDGLAGRLATVQLTSNTMGLVTVTANQPDGSSVTTGSSSAASFNLPSMWLPVSGTYTIVIDPSANNTGSMTVSVSVSAISTPPPSRTPPAILSPNNPLSTSLAGLFVMNEGSGTTDKNLVDDLPAAVAGTSVPTWNVVDPSIQFNGGASLNSYLNAGTDVSFDRLTVGKMTIVAKVYIPVLATGGLVEKNDGNTVDSGFVFGWDNTGAIKFTVERAGSNMRVASGAGTLAPGAWVQLAATWDGSTGTAAAAHLFIYGTELSKATSTDGVGTIGNANATNQPFRIGNGSFDVAGSFNGKMAYLAVYKGRILTPADMSALDAQLPTNAVDISQAITPGDPPVTVTTTAAGQNVQLKFSIAVSKLATVQLTDNTMGSVTVSLLNPDVTVARSTTSTAASFALPTKALTVPGVYNIYVQPSSPGSVSVAVTLADLPPIPARPTGSTLDTTNALSTNLVGLFVMNEATGSTDLNLANGQTAAFSGTSTPTWNTSDPSIVFNGGSSLNSYLNAGTDLAFDQLPTSRITIAAKVWVNTVAGGGIAEKNDGNTIDSGFVFGWDAGGALKLTMEKGSTNMRVATNAGVVTTGRWLQVAFTWDGTVGTAAAAHLFIDGVEQSKASSADGSGTLGYANATNKPFRIGNAGFDFAGALNGKMAYLAVYRGRILTTTELVALDAELPIH